jgi:hypothetical protein
MITQGTKTSTRHRNCSVWRGSELDYTQKPWEKLDYYLRLYSGSPDQIQGLVQRCGRGII